MSTHGGLILRPPSQGSRRQRVLNKVASFSSRGWWEVSQPRRYGRVFHTNESLCTCSRWEQSWCLQGRRIQSSRISLLEVESGRIRPRRGLLGAQGVRLKGLYPEGRNEGSNRMLPLQIRWAADILFDTSNNLSRNSLLLIFLVPWVIMSNICEDDTRFPNKRRFWVIPRTVLRNKNMMRPIYVILNFLVAIFFKISKIKWN